VTQRAWIPAGNTVAHALAAQCNDTKKVADMLPMLLVIPAKAGNQKDEETKDFPIADAVPPPVLLHGYGHFPHTVVIQHGIIHGDVEAEINGLCRVP
jgi:hypothetical protein